MWNVVCVTWCPSNFSLSHYSLFIQSMLYSPWKLLKPTSSCLDSLNNLLMPTTVWTPSVSQPVSSWIWAHLNWRRWMQELTASIFYPLIFITLYLCNVSFTFLDSARARRKASHLTLQCWGTFISVSLCASVKSSVLLQHWTGMSRVCLFVWFVTA